MRWNLRLRGLIEFLQAERSRAQRAKEKREGIRVALPLPRVPREGGQLVMAARELTGAIDARLHGWCGAERPVGDAKVGGPDRNVFELHFHDRAWVQLYEGVDDDTGEVIWTVRVQAKARELYGDDLRSWMGRWLGLWSWLLVGEWPDVRCFQGRRRLDELWSTTQWHLNCDFAGPPFGDEIVHNFLGPRRHARWGKQKTAREIGFTAYGKNGCPFVQTYAFGTSQGDVETCIYHKGDQLREVKRVSPDSSFYAPLWLRHGWDPDRDGDPIRVEYRFRKKGLVVRWPDRDDVRWDFRRPSMLLDDDAVSGFWRYWTERRRLVLPDATRRENCKTDPRWCVVQDAPGAPLPNVRGLRRHVREMTRHERLGKSLRAMILGAADQTAGRGVLADDLEQYGQAFIAIGLRMLRGDVPGLDTLPRPLDLKRLAERAEERAQFFADEALEEADAWAEELDEIAGVRVERRRIGGDDGDGGDACE